MVPPVRVVLQDLPCLVEEFGKEGVGGAMNNELGWGTNYKKSINRREKDELQFPAIREV